MTKPGAGATQPEISGPAVGGEVGAGVVAETAGVPDTDGVRVPVVVIVAETVGNGPTVVVTEAVAVPFAAARTERSRGARLANPSPRVDDITTRAAAASIRAAPAWISFIPCRARGRLKTAYRLCKTGAEEPVCCNANTVWPRYTEGGRILRAHVVRFSG